MQLEYPQPNPQPESFDFAGESLRVIDIGGEPWFVATDAASILGYRMASDATRMLADDETRTHSVRTSQGERQSTLVSESGLFSLILRSKREEAQQFRRWVTSVVLPSIRKTGSYGAPAFELPTDLPSALRFAAEQAERALRAEGQVMELSPAADAWASLSEADGDYSLREAAQILCRDPLIEVGQNRLMKKLRGWGWVDPRGRAYQPQVDIERLVMRVTSYDHPHTGEPKLSTQLRITPKGLLEIRSRILENLQRHMVVELSDQ